MPGELSFAKQNCDNDYFMLLMRFIPLFEECIESAGFKRSTMSHTITNSNRTDFFKVVKRLSIWFLIFSGALAFLASTLYFSRYVLLESLLVHQLQTKNIPLQSFTIHNISLNHLSIRDLSLGTHEELRIDQIDINWNLIDLVKGKLDVVSLKGITIWLDFSGQQPVLGSLHPLFDSPNSDKNSPVTIQLPAIAKLQAGIDFRSAQGNLHLNLSGTINQREALTQSAVIEFGLSGFSIKTNGQFNVTIDSTQAIQGRVAISDGTINRPDLEIAKISGEAAFTLLAMQLRQLKAELKLNEILLSESQQSITHAYKQASLNLQLIENHIQLAGALLTANHAPALDIQITANKPQDSNNFDITMNTSGQLGYLPWSLDDREQPSSGTFSLALHGSGQIPSQGSQSNDSSWLEQIQFEGNAQFDCQALGYETKLSNLSSNLGLKIAIDKGMGQVNLTPDSIIQLGSADLAWLTQSGLPPALSKDLAKGGTLRFNQPEQNQLSQMNWKLQSNLMDFTIQLFASLRSAQTRADFMSSGRVELELNEVQAARRVIDSWNGDFNLSTQIDHMDLGALTIHKMLINMPLKASARGKNWSVTLTEPGQIRFGLSDNARQFTIKQPLHLVISQLDVDAKQRIDDFSIKHQIKATLSPFSAWVMPKIEPIEVKIHPGRFALSGRLDKGQPYHAEGKWTGATALILQPQIKLENIVASLSLGTQKRALAQLTIGKLYHLADTPFFAPHTFSATINDKTKGKQHIYALDVSGGLPNLKYFHLKAEQNLDNGLGNVKFNLTPIHFIPGGTQLSDLLPALGQITDMQGVVHAHAQADWSKKGVQKSGGAIVADNLSFTHPTFRIAGLKTRIDFDKLLPISTPPQQRIHIQTIDPGILLSDLNIIYQIESNRNNQPRIRLEDTQLAILDGILAIEPVTIDPLSEDARITLTLNNIDLKHFFDSIQIEGLEGEGRLDGRIPVHLNDHRITIDKSRLMAKSPGILRFQSEKASQMLANAGTEMNLVLDVLEDFHYSELSLSIDKSAEHDLTATLSLLGQNPGVKEGQMIRLNINLASNLDKILKAISLGYNVSNEILKDLFR